MSRRCHTVSITTDVDIDMSQLETDDLIEELEDRKIPHACITDRHFEEIRRSVTQGRKPTENEVEFWWHVHGRQL